MNAPFLANAGKEEFKCWLELGKRLGKILYKMSKGYGKIDVSASGSILSDARGLISAGVAYGMVQSNAKDVNLINALEILKSTGAEVSIR